MNSMQTSRNYLFLRILLGAIFVMVSANAFAHCDSINGPLIPEAKAALEKGDVTPLLKWIKPDYEEAIRTAFSKAVKLRLRGLEEKEMADQYFLETLVRLHRAGEGAPFTGINAEPVDPVIMMADKALTDGSVEQMITRLNNHTSAVIREKYEKVMEARKHKDESVDAGREFVEAYVGYVHFVENLHTAIQASDAHHMEAGHKAETH